MTDVAQTEIAAFIWCDVFNYPIFYFGVIINTR